MFQFADKYYIYKIISISIDKNVKLVKYDKFNLSQIQKDVFEDPVVITVWIHLLQPFLLARNLGGPTTY